MDKSHGTQQDIRQEGGMIPSVKDNIRYALKAFDTMTYDGQSISPENFPGKTCYILTDRDELQRLSPKLGPVIRDLTALSDDQISDSVFYIYFTYDSDALPMLKKIKAKGGSFVSPSPMLVNKTSYCFGINRLAHHAMIKTWSCPNVSHLNDEVHQNICEALEITRHLSGDYLEIGVYKGGSALTALNFIDEMSAQSLVQPRHCWLLDTFDGFVYEEASNSIDLIWNRTHRQNGVESAQQNIKQNFANVTTPYSLHVSNICKDELPTDIGPIVVANIDVDMYEATSAALIKVSPHVVRGGIIICEDAASTPALYGAFLAMEEFLASTPGKKYVKVFKGGQYFLIKNR